MNIKMSAISASVLLMLSGGVMAAEESYEIQYKGEVVSDSCIITGNGAGLTFELQPVLASVLQKTSTTVNFESKPTFAKVVCEGEMKSVKIAWDESIPTKESTHNKRHAIIPENVVDGAGGTYVYTFLRARTSDGEVYRFPNDSSEITLAMTSKDGYMEAPIEIAAGYTTAMDDKGVLETVTPGSVFATAPIVLSYQ